MREVTLAVVGAAQAGKSTFVQCALDLKNPPTSASATKKVSLEGVVSILRLLEIQMSDVIIDPEQNVVWPRTVGGQSFSHVHGALVLYDVMDQGSLNRIPSVLSEFAGLISIALSPSLSNSTQRQDRFRCALRSDKNPWSQLTRCCNNRCALQSSSTNTARIFQM